MATRLATIPADFDVLAALYIYLKGFWRWLVVSVVLHALAMAYYPFQPEPDQSPRPLPTKFIKREPRLTKPLELRKIPPRKLMLLRHVARPAFPRVGPGRALARFSPAIQPHAQPLATIASSASVAPLAGGSHELIAAPLAIARRAEHPIDLALDLLDVDHLDTGRYQALIVADPEDRRAIRGFVKLPFVTSMRELGTDIGQGYARQVEALADGLNQYTGVRTEIVETTTFDDRRLLEVPLLPLPYMENPTETEIESAVRYVLAGGFILWSVNMATDQLFEGLEKYGGLVRGEDFWWEMLPPDHAIYSSFFDIHGGVARRSTPVGIYARAESLSGFFVRGRMIGAGPIQSYYWTNPQIDDANRGERELMLAVNAAIYALTQEGSIAQRLSRQVR